MFIFLWRWNLKSVKEPITYAYVHQNLKGVLIEDSREAFNVFENRDKTELCFLSLKNQTPSPGQILESKTSVNV